MGRVKDELLNEKGKVWIRCTTTGECDASWGVYLQDPNDLPNGWIDVIYEDNFDEGREAAEEWAKREGYEIIPDPSGEDAPRKCKLLVLWSTPSEEPQITMFTGFPADASPWFYKSQIETFIGNRTVAAPYFMMRFDEDELIPQVFGSTLQYALDVVHYELK